MSNMIGGRWGPQRCKGNDVDGRPSRTRMVVAALFDGQHKRQEVLHALLCPLDPQGTPFSVPCGVCPLCPPGRAPFDNIYMIIP